MEKLAAALRYGADAAYLGGRQFGLRAFGGNFTEDEIKDADIIYMTRVQKERFSDLMEYERVKNVYILRNEMLAGAKPNMKIMHPLPRVNEIAYDVDDSPHAYYIQQAQNGLYAREAIYSYCLGITLDDIKNDTTIINSKF